MAEKGIVPEMGLRVRVVSPCGWTGREGKIKQIDPGPPGDEVVHVIIGEDTPRQFWSSELALIEVGRG
jgi:hypothetical protein